MDNKDKEKDREEYGRYFMGRTVSDIMEEWSDARDEWFPVKESEDGNKED